MKKVTKTAAICSVVVSSATTAASPYLNNECILTRGGTATSPTNLKMENKTSIPENAAFEYKKRKKKLKNQKESSTEKGSPDMGYHPKEPQQEKKSKPDPFVETVLRQEEYYAILGISKTSTKAQVTKAYRKRAVRTHPDKTGGDRRAFDRVSEAYDVLSDDSKRQIYDRFGKRGLEQGASGVGAGFAPEDLFRQFFGQRTQQQFRQPRTMRYQIEITLEDLYRGFTQDILVDIPGGRKNVELHVPRGFMSGEAIVLSGELDFPGGGAPGDIIFIIQQSPHHKFSRKGNDIAIELSITLEEAVSGVKRDIIHLDGRRICFQSAEDINRRSAWIQTGDIQVLKGEGMPKRDTIDEFGDLYIQYRVEIPKSTDRLSDEECKLLSSLLGRLQDKPKSLNKDDTIKRQILQKAKSSDFGRASGIYRERREESRNAGRSRSSFFWSNSHGSAGHNPFFGSSQNSFSDADDGSNVECQQM